MLYVLDEPSIGLHPANIKGLIAVMNDLINDGNSVVLVDHDAQILNAADWMIEMGPKAGAGGGTVVAEGPLEAIEADPKSLIGPFLSGQTIRSRKVTPKEHMFGLGVISMETDSIHTVHPLSVRIPKGRLTVVTGVSGSGKQRSSSNRLCRRSSTNSPGSPSPLTSNPSMRPIFGR